MTLFLVEQIADLREQFDFLLHRIFLLGPDPAVGKHDHEIHHRGDQDEIDGPTQYRVEIEVVVAEKVNAQNAVLLVAAGADAGDQRLDDPVGEGLDERRERRTDDNRDRGKVFVITELPASKAEAWAMRAILALLANNVELPDGFERLGMELLYDCCHNIAKIERIVWEGRQIEVCVHRKGATRALLPGDARLPERFRATGQPVLVPGDMGRASYVLAGDIGAQETFLSACHGAGRRLSRSMAKRQAKGRSILDELKNRDIHAMAASRATLAEEMPEAYKDVSLVVDTITGAGVARAVARLRPIAMIKG